jgi:hypothetical protein
MQQLQILFHEEDDIIDALLTLFGIFFNQEVASQIQMS